MAQFELKYCSKCIQMTNHLDGACQKCEIDAYVSLPTSPKSWPEDYSHENGSYINQCYLCKSPFIGHKRRVVCKECHNTWVKDRVNPKNKRREDYK